MQKQTKMRLKPSMLENKRYLLLDANASKEEIETAILNYIGVLGWAKASPVFIGNFVENKIVAKRHLTG